MPDVGRLELSLVLVCDSSIRALNRQWRRKDAATDVLSFPLGEAPGPVGGRLLGDIVISMDTARRAAKAHGESIEDELARYLAHGLLHLLGFDHRRRSEAKEMERMERRLLGRAGMLG